MRRVATHVAFFIATLTLSASQAFAAPILWTAQNVTFDDGTALVGTFTYDASVNAYSNWNISVQAGAFLPAYTYQPGLNGGFSGSASDELVDFVAFTPIPASGRYVRFDFDGLLTNAGGTVNLLTGGFSWECNNCGLKRLITGGSVTTTPVAPVPEPASLLLLGSGLVGIARARYRRNRQAR